MMAQARYQMVEDLRYDTRQYRLQVAAMGVGSHPPGARGHQREEESHLTCLRQVAILEDNP